MKMSYICVVIVLIQLLTLNKGDYNLNNRSVEENDITTEQVDYNLFNNNVFHLGSRVAELDNNHHSADSKGLDTIGSFNNKMVDIFKKRIHAIYPGTLWCGDGDISTSNDQLGLYYKTDKCCREHDRCDDYISAGESKYGLKNTGLFTRSNCECDFKLHNCLKQADTFVSNQIGFTYFTLLGPQCFKKDYPIVTCRFYREGRCINYIQNKSQSTIEQWFDNPTYS